MDRPRNNQFLDSERAGPGMIGWAVKQLALWLVGGFIVYSVVVNHQLFRGADDKTTPRSAAATASRPVSAAPRMSDDGAPLVTNSLTLAAQSNGHVVLDADINGTPIRFVVDTGATWVSLTHDDAARAGVMGILDYSVRMTTANGVIKAAPATLRRVSIGQLEVDDVAAMVLPERQGISLLGQSFLNRLRGYAMRNGVLTLTW